MNKIRKVVPLCREPVVPKGQIDVTHVAGQAYAVSVHNHELTVDQPPDAGGENDGPTPVELFVASPATCVAYYAGRFLQRHHLPHESLRVRAHFDMAEDLPARVVSIRMSVRTPEQLGAARGDRHAARAEWPLAQGRRSEPPWGQEGGRASWKRSGRWPS